MGTDVTFQTNDWSESVVTRRKRSGTVLYISISDNIYFYDLFHEYAPSDKSRNIITQLILESDRMTKMTRLKLKAVT